MEFLKVYDSVVQEFGFGVRCAVYSKILEFHMNGLTCLMSKKTLAEFIQCRKSSVCDALAFLLEDTEHAIEVINGKKKRIECADSAGNPIPKEPYIFATYRKKDDGSADTTVYVINEKHRLFKSITEPKTGSPEIGQGSPKNGQRVVQKSDRGLSENRTEGCLKIGQKKRTSLTETFNRQSEKRVCDAPAPDSARKDFVSIPDYPEIKLTQSEIDKLKHGVNYEKAKRKGFKEYLSLLDSQLAKGKVYPDHFRQLRHWITEDGGRFLDDRTTEQNKQNAEAIAAIMNKSSGFPEISMDSDEVRTIKDPNTGEEVLCKKNGQDEYYHEIGGKCRTFACFGNYVEEIW